MMILSKHIVEYDDLKYRNDDRCLLCNRHIYVSVTSLDDDDDMDGNYLVYEIKSGINFRSGMAEAGAKRRWKEHVSASMRSSNEHRNNKIYAFYPSINCDVENLPSEDEKLGNFQ